jgi:hypothetical protein
MYYSLRLLLLLLLLSLLLLLRLGRRDDQTLRAAVVAVGEWLL